MTTTHQILPEDVLYKICYRRKGLSTYHYAVAVPHPDTGVPVLAEKTQVYRDGQSFSVTQYVSFEEFFGINPIEWLKPDENGYIIPGFMQYKYKYKPPHDIRSTTYRLVKDATRYDLWTNNCGNFAFECACEAGETATAFVGQGIVAIAIFGAIAYLLW